MSVKERVFIHGSAQDSGTWNNVIESIRAGINVTPDMKGYGSRKGEIVISLVDWAEDIEGIITKKCNTPPLIVGFSLGGVVALEILRRRNVEISSAILISTPYDDLFMKSHWRFVVKVLKNSARSANSLNWLVENGILVNKVTMAFVHPAKLKNLKSYLTEELHYGHDLRKGHVKTTLVALNEIANSDYTSVLSRNETPITVISGEKDDVVYPDYAQGWRRFPLCDLHVVSGSGHSVHLDRTDYIAKVINSIN